AGRIGTLNRIAAVCIQAMQNNYGTNTQDVFAGIGPSIGPDHYEIREDVVQQAEMCFEDLNGVLIHAEGGKTFLNLWEANRRILSECGVQHIEVAEICTACHTDEWFSHRAENGQTGRFGALLALGGEI
ncbi:MAG TPA: laccase domain-containing protein, partial [Leptolinea sp.]